MKLLTALSAAVLAATTLFAGAADGRGAAVVSLPPAYFSCESGTLCVEDLQFSSMAEGYQGADPAQTRTATIYNDTSGPVTVAGYKFVHDTLPDPSFAVGSETCTGLVLQPGDECGVNVAFSRDSGSKDPESATLEVDATDAGGAAVKGTATVQLYRPIPPDNDLYADQVDLSFTAQHVGAESDQKTVTLTGYGSDDDSIWYEVLGTTVVDDRPPGFPSEYRVDASNCLGSFVNIEAGDGYSGTSSCGISVTATPHSDGEHDAILDITYCSTFSPTPEYADCASDAPRHLLIHLTTTVPWNPESCDSLCVEPLIFLPVDSDTGKPFDPILTRTSTVYNGTEETLTVDDTTLQNSDGVFDINPVDTCRGATLAPGDECGVSVRLRDDGNPHLRTALVVNAAASSGCDEDCQVAGIGSVTSRPTDSDMDRDLYAVPPILDVGSAIVGTATDAQTVALSGWADASGYDGLRPQWNRVMDVTVFGPQAADFKADATDCANKDVNIDAGTNFDTFVLAGVTSCKLSITAVPSAIGMRQAYLDVTYCTVDVTSDSSNYPPQPSCFDNDTPRHVLIAVSALGLGLPSLGGCDTLCVEPLNFLPPPDGTDLTNVRTATVLNGTGQPVTVTAESFVAGANRFDVYPSQTCFGKTLAPGGTCAVSVRYTDDGATHREAALRVDGVHPGGAAVTGRGVIVVRADLPPDSDLYAVPPVLDFGTTTVGKRSAPLSTTLTGWGATGAGPLWYRVLGVSVIGTTAAAQPTDYTADGSGCATAALNIKADPATGFLGTPSCTVTVTDLPPAPGVRPAGLDISYCQVTAPTAPCDGETTPRHVLVGLTATGARPVFQPKLTVSPAVSPAGRVIHVTGTGFPADAGFVLALTAPGTPPTTNPAVLGALLMRTVGRTDGNGTLTADLLIMPATVAATYPLQAVAADVYGNQGSAQLGFLVVPGTQQIVPGPPTAVLARH